MEIIPNNTRTRTNTGDSHSRGPQVAIDFNPESGAWEPVENTDSEASRTITPLKLRKKPDGSLESYVAGPSPEAALLEECRQWVKDYLILTPEQAAILAAFDFFKRNF